VQRSRFAWHSDTARRRALRAPQGAPALGHVGATGDDNREASLDPTEASVVRSSTTSCLKNVIRLSRSMAARGRRLFHNLVGADRAALE